MDGKIIAVGFLLSAAASMPIIDVGKIWILEHEIATSIIIGKVTVFLFGLSFCIDSIAFIPSGVAAPFMPSKFADMFMVTQTGRKSKKRGDMCKHTADSLRYTAETNITL